MKVRVYWNLHRKLWSVQDAKSRRVIGHATKLNLRDCTFTVSEAGRQRVLREKAKNVHAFVVGELEGAVWDTHGWGLPMNWTKGDDGYARAARKRLGVFAKYNPYKAPTFRSVDVCRGTDLGELHAAPFVHLYSPDHKPVVLHFDPLDMTEAESAAATF